MDTIKVELTPPIREVVHAALLEYINELDAAMGDGDENMVEMRKAIAALHLIRHNVKVDPCPTTLNYIRRALDSDNYLVESYFVGITSSGSEQHSIAYEDDDKPDGLGHSYAYVREHNGKIVAEES